MNYDTKLSTLTKKQFVIIALGKDILIINLEGKIIKTLKGHARQILSLISLDNNTIASSSYDGTIRVWNVDTCLLPSDQWDVDSDESTTYARTVKNFEIGSEARHMIKISNNTIAYTQERKGRTLKHVEVEIRDLSKKEIVKTLPGSQLIHDIFTIGNNIIVGSVYDYIAIWDITKPDGNERIGRIDITSTNVIAKINDHTIASGNGSYIFVWDISSILQHSRNAMFLPPSSQWDISPILSYSGEAKKISILRGTRRVQSIVYMGDNILAASYSYGPIYIWDLSKKDGRLINELSPPENILNTRGISDLYYLNNNTLIVTYSLQYFFSIWDITKSTSNLDINLPGIASEIIVIDDLNYNTLILHRLKSHLVSYIPEVLIGELYNYI